MVVVENEKQEEEEEEEEEEVKVSNSRHLRRVVAAGDSQLREVGKSDDVEQLGEETVRGNKRRGEGEEKRRRGGRGEFEEGSRSKGGAEVNVSHEETDVSMIGGVWPEVDWVLKS
eukprot:46410-Hanusia_phi.AAC.2